MHGRMPAQRAQRAAELERMHAAPMHSPEERACWQRLRETGEVAVAPGHRLHAYLTKCQQARSAILDDSDLFTRVEAHLTRLGWRVPTDAELHDRLLARRRKTLDGRVELLRQVREFEARPAGPRLDRAPRKLRFLGADLEGLEGLTDEEREAARGELAERICLLAESGRVVEIEEAGMRKLL